MQMPQEQLHDLSGSSIVCYTCRQVNNYDQRRVNFRQLNPEKVSIKHLRIN